MRTLLYILCFLNGGYMFADGIYVMVNGKYIGPEKPGPWSVLFERMGFRIFELGPMFLYFGIAWLLLLAGLYSRRNWAYQFGMLLAVLTLWYLPLGTLFSIVVFIILLRIRRKGI